jgi:hypothetical protein
MYEPLSLLFKYKCELNGYLYLAKLLNNKYNVNYNDLKSFKLSLNTNIDTSQVLNIDNIYIIDFKKVKLVNNENIFRFIELILITNIKTNYKFIKYDYNVIILMNINYINELFISKLIYIIEKYQGLNNFIMFSSNYKINDIKFKKLITLSTCIKLNPFKEFNLKYTINEKKIFSLLNNSITKTELLIQVAKEENIKLTKLKAIELYNFICDNILIYNIINKNLITNKIYDLTFNLISMYPLLDIISVINNIISFSTINKLDNKYNLGCQIKLIEFKQKSSVLNSNNIDLIKLKKYLSEIKKFI